LKEQTNSPQPAATPDATPADIAADGSVVPEGNANNNNNGKKSPEWVWDF